MKTNIDKLKKTFAAFGITFDPAKDKYTTSKEIDDRQKCVNLALSMAKHPEIKEMLYREFLRA